ncbi:hypothetical protein V2W45_1244409, partial [Cenococcum geophilum]
GVIKYLYRFLVLLKEEEKYNLNVTNQNFTVIISSYNKSLLLFLGPGRCINYNYKGNIKLKEIIIKYRNHYFSKDNYNCLYATCVFIG